MKEVELIPIAAKKAAKRGISDEWIKETQIIRCRLLKSMVEEVYTEKVYDR